VGEKSKVWKEYLECRKGEKPKNLHDQMKSKVQIDYIWYENPES